MFLVLYSVSHKWGISDISLFSGAFQYIALAHIEPSFLERVLFQPILEVSVEGRNSARILL